MSPCFRGGGEEDRGKVEEGGKKEGCRRGTEEGRNVGLVRCFRGKAFVVQMIGQEFESPEPI